MKECCRKRFTWSSLSRMKSFAVAWFLLAFAYVGSAQADRVPPEVRPLIAKPNVMAQGFCYADPSDSEIFFLWIKLRIDYKNTTNKTVIIDKKIGTFWYWETVAQNVNDLVATKYEYEPQIDWTIDAKQVFGVPNPKSPGSDFLILRPGQMFESNIDLDVSVPLQREGLKSHPGILLPGPHVLQVDLSAWVHPGEASKFAKSWRKIGELATGIIKSDPLEIPVPSHPAIETQCK